MITVYYCETPEMVNPKVKNLVGGFKTLDEKDEAMTNASFEDIALVRDCNELTYTAKNILRRYSL